jgi:hypothetical protein
MKYKINDKITTSQDWHEAYQGEIVKIKRYPHPNRSDDQDLTWYTITTPRLNAYGKNYTFITNDIEGVQL